MRMRMKEICAAVAATIAASAYAQSAVQLMGTVDAYVGTAQMAGDPGRKTVVNSGGMTTSWFGFKGKEDLGGGLAATFALTGFVQVDTGTPGRFTGDPFFSRDANVGLAGNFGSLVLGRALAPNFLPTIIFNPFGDSFTFSPLVLHANVPLFNGTGWAATTPSDTGWANELLYTSPSFGGLTANVHYQLGEIPGSGKHNVGLNLLYFHGPFAAGAFYERDQVSNPAPAAFASNDVKTDWMVGSSYDFSAVKVYATYGRSASDTLVPRAKTLSLGASVPFGAGKFLAGTARTAITNGSVRRTTTFGYDYDLSKSTDVYAMLMRDAITGATSGTSWGLGIRKRF
jgi:predicted porin